jgi:peptidoglycan-associated lipoprotein
MPGMPGVPGMQNDPSRDAAEQGRPVGRPPAKDFSPVSDLIDVHFEFDRYDIPPGEAKVLESNARWLRSNRNLVLIEGHCDERGTSEYNLALGERRAASAMNYLVSQGIAASRITIVSYGKERPQCTDGTDSCWRKNRRAHFLVKRQ